MSDGADEKSNARSAAAFENADFDALRDLLPKSACE
jgi:hypothetical protein